MEKLLSKIYVGPTGINPELGFCEHGKEKLIPESLYDKYLGLGYIREEEEEKSTKKFKRSKTEED